MTVLFELEKHLYDSICDFETACMLHSWFRSTIWLAMRMKVYVTGLYQHDDICAVLLFIWSDLCWLRLLSSGQRLFAQVPSVYAENEQVS